MDSLDLPTDWRELFLLINLSCIRVGKKTGETISSGLMYLLLSFGYTFGYLRVQLKAYQI